MAQMESWLTDGNVQRLVVVVTGIDSGETLERWQFNVAVEDVSAGVDVSVIGGNNENVSNNIEKKNSNGSDNKATRGSKTVKQVHDEIQAIIRQITASVSIDRTTSQCLNISFLLRSCTQYSYRICAISR